MKIFNNYIKPTIMAGVFGLSAASCTGEGVESRLLNYTKDRPAKETLEIIKTADSRFINNEKYIQSKLDSIAFRDVLDFTPAKNDSVIISKFNKIAGAYREHFADSLKNNLTVREYQVATKGRLFESSCVGQYMLDSVAYTKFFIENKLMNQVTKAKILEVTSKIKPRF